MEFDCFVMVVLYDLQELLCKISVFVGFICCCYIDKLDEEGICLLEFLVDVVECMQILIDDLLSYFCMVSQFFWLEWIDLNDIIVEVCEFFVGVIEENLVELDIDDLFVVWGDLILLKQVLVNLIGNVIKYC